MPIWIVVADASCARILAAESPRGALAQVTELTHPASRAHPRQLGTDAPGRGFGPPGAGRHAMDPPTDLQRIEAQRFAAEVATALRRHRLAGDFERLYLVAPPAFLGMLRQELDEATRGLVSAELAKELAQLPVHELRSHLPQRL